MASAADQRWSLLALVRLGAYGFGVTGLVFALDTVILPTRVLAIVPENLKHSYLRPWGSVGFPWRSNSSGCREGQRPDSLTVGARGSLPDVGIGLRAHGSVGGEARARLAGPAKGPAPTAS